MYEKAKDIKYVCDKVDTIENRVNDVGNLVRNPGLYMLMVFNLICSFNGMYTTTEAKRKVIEVQTQVQEVETKLDNIEKMLTDLQQKDK